MANVRLKDIAARAGVSMMTVSKALRGQPDVSAATRARLKDLAQQMGYTPDSTAQGLRNRSTNLLGLVISSSTDPSFARLLLALEERVYELGWDLVLMHTLNKVEREEACLRRLLARRVEGVFIVPVYRMDPVSRIYQELEERAIPTLLLGHPAPFCPRFPGVAVDDLPASQAATRHLLDLGHRRIAYLAGPLAAPWAQARFEGHRRAMSLAGLEVDEKLVFQAGSTIEDGVRTALQMFNEGSDATAVVAANDLVAIGFSDTCLNQGLKIPGDLSVIGFGNVLASEYFRVPLTTVRQPKYRLGLAAVEMMMQLLQRERVESKRLPAELVIRASSGVPASVPVLSRQPQEI